MSENLTPKEETDKRESLDKDGIKTAQTQPAIPLPKREFPTPEQRAWDEKMMKHYLRMETDEEYRKEIQKRLS